NHLGQYHCWNRDYDLHTGRWTTPDPLQDATWNFFSYPDRPTGERDRNGLQIGPPVGPQFRTADTSGRSDLGLKDCGQWGMLSQPKSSPTFPKTFSSYNVLLWFLPPAGCCCCTEIRLFQMVRARI